MTTITVCTPWWQAHELAERYIAAVRDEGAERVLILDQASDPPLDLPFEVARAKRNVGFSRACNWMLAQAETDAVLWLNNDIELALPGWLDAIRTELEPGRLVGAQLREDDHTAVDGETHAYLDGWCLAGLRDDLVALGGWDEDFEEPSYFGDNDLSLRARRAGMEIKAVPVGLHHLGTYTGRRFELEGVMARNYERYAAKVRASRIAGRV